jgi:hypothetical protein
MWFLEVSWPVEQGKFEYATALAQRFLRHEFNLVWFPQEVTYAFPTILFFSA